MAWAKFPVLGAPGSLTGTKPYFLAYSMHAGDRPQLQQEGAPNSRVQLINHCWCFKRRICRLLDALPLEVAQWHPDYFCAQRRWDSRSCRVDLGCGTAEQGRCSSSWQQRHCRCTGSESVRWNGPQCNFYDRFCDRDHAYAGPPIALQVKSHSTQRHPHPDPLLAVTAQGQILVSTAIGWLCTYCY